ncbi:MAG: class I SAM-dependent methyltransferase [Rhodothermales bacterium]|nr:class I SAM-dependent methyltransferase [Rhodothermales bacterium]
MWYDFFSLFYDRALEDLYRTAREQVVSELQVTSGSIVLDIACGTGQNFPLIQRSIGDGLIVGIDVSRGMLNRARHRVRSEGWSNVTLCRKRAAEFSRDDLVSISGSEYADFVICTLGLTVMDDWKQVLSHTLDLLKPGGRIVLFDAYIEEPVFRTRCANIFARADLSRKFWEPLEGKVDAFRLIQMSGSPKDFGGNLFLASGVKSQVDITTDEV